MKGSAAFRIAAQQDSVAEAKQSVTLSADQVQLIARALADPRRYEILKHISRVPQPFTPCSAVRGCVDISPATLSHHMKELETAGLIRSEKDGKFVNYIPQPQILKAFFNRLRSDLL